MVRFRKLLKPLFLTLHGHNIHCQQRELSKFLMQFASHAYCEATGPSSKMALRPEKAFCVLRFRCPDLRLQCSVSFVHGLKTCTKRTEPLYETVRKATHSAEEGSEHIKKHYIHIHRITVHNIRFLNKTLLLHIQMHQPHNICAR
jgi:hypothetical protein